MTTAGSGDMQQVRSIARRMVGQWGFSVTDKGAAIGIVGWESDGAGRYEAITRSDSTGWDIDQEVMAMCDEAYARTKSALTKHRPLVDMLVAKLLDQETVNAGLEPQPSPPSPRPYPQTQTQPQRLTP